MMSEAEDDRPGRSVRPEQVFFFFLKSWSKAERILEWADQQPQTMYSKDNRLF